MLSRLGRLHIDLTEFRQAKDFYSRAVIAKKTIGDLRGEAGAQDGVCRALHFLGDRKGAEQCIGVLLPIYRELGDRLEEARSQLNIAVILDGRNDYQAALQLARQALGVFQAEGDRVQQSNALNTLGQIYGRLNSNRWRSTIMNARWRSVAKAATSEAWG